MIGRECIYIYILFWIIYYCLYNSPRWMIPFKGKGNSSYPFFLVNKKELGDFETILVTVGPLLLQTWTIEYVTRTRRCRLLNMSRRYFNDYHILCERKWFCTFTGVFPDAGLGVGGSQTWLHWMKTDGAF